MSPGVERFFAYARERYRIFLARNEDRGSGPWTQDPVLQQFRFCNIFREDDRVTRWMRANLTSQIPPWDKERHFRAAVVFRWFNKIETGELLKGLLLKRWDTETARWLLKERVAKGQTILGAAYMIKSLIGVNKVDGLLDSIDKINADIPHLAARIENGETTLQGVHEVLCSYPYLGPFMAYEMVTDMRHSPLLSEAPDIYTWASAGPGAARGLCRVFDLPLGTLSHNSPADRAEMNKSMHDLLLLSGSMPDLWPGDWPAWEMREVEHTLCEFDKYERARLGEGRPKQRYSPGGNDG
jgi:hypothetical protein